MAWTLYKHKMVYFFLPAETDSGFLNDGKSGRAQPQNFVEFELYCRLGTRRDESAAGAGRNPLSEGRGGQVFQYKSAV